MSRPQVLTLSALAAAMSSEWQSPSKIALSLGVSRATLHRKLSALTEQGLALQAGNRRSSVYRLSTAAEELEQARAAAPQRTVRLEMPTVVAGLLREALENVARLGIGQIEQVAQLLRWEAFGPDKRFSIEQINAIEVLIKDFKTFLLQLSPTSSHGIYSDHVDTQIRSCWALYRAIRHRMAWDHTPAGGAGVSFDEPLLDEDLLVDVMVLSHKNSDGQGFLSIEVSSAMAKVVAHALRCHGRLVDGDFRLVIDLANEGLIKTARGSLVEKTTADTAGAMAQTISDALHFDAVAAPSALRLKCDGMADAIEAVANESDSAHWPADGPQELTATLKPSTKPEVSLVDLPAGCFVQRMKKQYRVIGPSEDPERLLILSESHSVQTAVQMALNKLSNAPKRDWAN